MKRIIAAMLCAVMLCGFSFSVLAVSQMGSMGEEVSGVLSALKD